MILRLAKKSRLGGGAALLWALSPLGAAKAQIILPEPAGRADDFVDGIGVCTHWGYTDTPYGFAYDKVSGLLNEAGIRWVRDGLHPRLAELYAKYGIRSCTIFNPGDAAKTVKTIKENQPYVAMIEGPNEVALFKTSADYQGKGFPDGPRLWTKDLYAALNADPVTAKLPIIAPSTGQSNANLKLAPLRQFDLCVMHSYAGGGKPSDSLYGEINNNIVDAYSLLGPGAELKRLAVTESGYHTALGSDVVIGGAQPGVTEKAQGKYLLRHFAEYFNAGIVRTFTYEFVDEFKDYGKDEREATNAEACFGVIKQDLTPKPAYTALKNLITLLSESKWDAAGKKRIRPAPNFKPRALPFMLTGETKDVHRTLLQKADGDWYLLLWRETESFDRATRQDISVTPANVTLALNAPFQMSVHSPGAASDALFELETASRVALKVPDEMMVVRLHAVKAVVSAPSPPAPLALSATPTDTTAKLIWTPPPRKRDRPACWFVYRMGAFVARVTEPTFTDTKLIPGKGYAYSVVACNSAGQLSPPVRVLASTKLLFPDLIITEIGLDGDPKAGQEVRLKAVIKNIGNAATPANVVHGVAFNVDGQFISWSDTFKGPLKPGASVTVISNAGPKGTATWKAVAGTHKITAISDDVNRIVEGREDNNTLDREITIVL